MVVASKRLTYPITDSDMQAARLLLLLKQAESDRFAATMLQVLSKDDALRSKIRQATQATEEAVECESRSLGSVQEIPKAAVSPPYYHLPTPPDTPPTAVLETPLTTEKVTAKTGPVPRKRSTGKTAKPPTPISTVAPRSAHNPRKRKADNDAEEQASSKHERKRENMLNAGEILGACIKATLTAMESGLSAKEVLEQGIFEEGRRLFPQDGTGSPRHDDELKLAAQNGYTEHKGNLGQYYVNKYRVGMGAIILTEHNMRLKKVGDKDRRFSSLKITQAQQCCNVDVKITSALFRKWQEWQWIPIMNIGGNSKKQEILNPVMETMFPITLRSKLIADVIKYEEEHKDNPNWTQYPAVARNELI